MSPQLLGLATIFVLVLVGRRVLIQHQYKDTRRIELEDLLTFFILKDVL